MGEEEVTGRPFSELYLTDRPIRFEIDRDTGLATLVVQAGFGPPGFGKASIYMPIRIVLAEESARALLADLHELEETLLKAKRGTAKPDFLQ